jgi:hypothetical protein
MRTCVAWQAWGHEAGLDSHCEACVSLLQPDAWDAGVALLCQDRGLGHFVNGGGVAGGALHITLPVGCKAWKER